MRRSAAAVVGVYLSAQELIRLQFAGSLQQAPRLMFAPAQVPAITALWNAGSRLMRLLLDPSEAAIRKKCHRVARRADRVAASTTPLRQAKRKWRSRRRVLSTNSDSAEDQRPAPSIRSERESRPAV